MEHSLVETVQCAIRSTDDSRHNIFRYLKVAKEQFLQITAKLKIVSYSSKCAKTALTHCDKLQEIRNVTYLTS